MMHRGASRLKLFLSVRRFGSDEHVASVELASFANFPCDVQLGALSNREVLVV
jgi:hypothetical protein